MAANSPASAGGRRILRSNSSEIEEETWKVSGESSLTARRQTASHSTSRAAGVVSLLVLSFITMMVYWRTYSSLVVHHHGDVQSHQGRVHHLNLTEAVENVAGPNRSIIFVSASSDYLDFLENWFASVSRFGYESRVLFIAEDEQAYEYLLKKWPSQSTLARPDDFNVPDVETNSSIETNSTYGSSHYNALVDRRPEYFKALIDLKVTFLYNDVDIVWLKDPYPFFIGDYDMWVEEDAIVFNGSLSRFAGGHPAPPIRDKRYAICTCFMMVQPTRASRRLVHRWSRHVRTRVLAQGKAVLNQPAFNKALSLTPDTDIKVGVLPIIDFPSGFIFFKCAGQPYCKKNLLQRALFLNASEERKSWPAVVHNNWLEGHDLKLQRFKDYNLWFVQ